jgi:Skp family chaperone for outer membrane proteins
MLKLSWSLLVLVAVTGIARAGETRVGVVDFAKIYTETATAKKDRAELDLMMKQKQAAVDAEKAKVARLQSELQTTRNKLSPGDVAKREAEVDVESAALRKLFEEAEKAVNDRERELSGRVISDAKQLAPDIAKQHNLSLVLGATEAILWAAPSVVQVDLTGEVAQAIDRMRTRQTSVLRRSE